MASEKRYYRPYLPSDSELSDSDSEGSWNSSSSGTPTPDNAEGLDHSQANEEGPDFAALANALNASMREAIEAAGPSLVTIKQEDAYGHNRLDPRTTYSPFAMTDASGMPLKSNGQAVNTVVVLESRNRDKLVYPQPTNCQLFLPRTYRNITSFSIVQLNLTSAFFYFSQAKNNVDISIQEQNRTSYLANSTKTPSDTGTPLILNASIRQGSYTIDTLLTELNTQLNKTPLFYDFIDGFTEFASVFVVNGDYSLNFNEPGDNYYDAVSKTFIKSPTREIIAGYYFQARYALSYTFTTQQITNAYYYPVLKEVILDPEENLDAFNLTYSDFTRTQIIQYLIYSFTGIDDQIASTIINNNISRLDTYRLFHTYRYALVNKYVCSYEQTSNRVTINTPSLSTSLSNLLITQYNSFLTQQLSFYKIGLADYNSLTSTITGLLSAIQSMYDYMQVRLATYFAIDFGTYSRVYFTNSNNSLLLRPGLSAEGVSLNFNPAAPIQSRSSDILADFQNPPLYYWPYMTGLTPAGVNPASTQGMLGPAINMGSAIQAFPASSNFPYSLSESNIDLTRHFIDLSGGIYLEPRRKAADILISIQAGKYTVFKFRSKFRQTLQVETLPRQTAFRYPAWNKVNPVEYPLATLYDISYSYVNPTGVLQSNIINDISYNAVYGWSTMMNQGTDNIWNTSTNFSATFTQSSNFWTLSNGQKAQERIDVTNSNGRYYRFIAPYPVDPVTKDSNVYKYPYQVSIVATQQAFPEDYYAFFYHDVTALAADASKVGVRNENPINYKYKLTIGSNTTSNSYTFNAYAGQNYYMILRSESASPTPVYYQVIPSCPSGSIFTTLSQSLYLADGFDPMKDPTTMLYNFNAAKVNDPDFIRLPVANFIDSNTPVNTTNILKSSNVPIGYDTNGISTDLTDYIPFAPFSYVSTINPNAAYRIDPTNDYVFQYNTPYNSFTQNYLSSNSGNLIFNRNAVIKYTPQTVIARQYKIAQYYATTYIQNYSDYSVSDITSNVQPYSLTTTGGAIGGYKYINSLINLDSGVCGFTFLPGDGTWAIDRMTFKTNFINTNTTNSNIHCMGVFFTADINNLYAAGVSLKNAVGIFLRVKDNIYTSNTMNLGFDSGYGTYHTFSNYFDTFSADPTLSLRSNFNISGFTQAPKTFIRDVTAYCSAIAFTFTNINTWNTGEIDLDLVKTAIKNDYTVICPIQNMVGTPIPYPQACTPSVSRVFYDGIPAPNGKDIVISSDAPASNIYGPNTAIGADESVSVYEQSLPIINSHLHYLTPQNIISYSNGFSEWTNIPVPPDYLHISVYDTTVREYDNPTDENKYSWYDGYALMQGSTFSIYKYKIYININAYTQPDRKFAFMGQIATQQIFPDNERTSLIAVTGNSSRYVFLGSSNNYLRFKEYNPVTGTMTELTQNRFYTFDANAASVQRFVYNDSRAWFITASSSSSTSEINSKVVLIGAPSYSSRSNNMIVYSNDSMRFSELQINSTNLYFSPFNGNGFTSINVYSLNSNDPQYVGNLPTATGYIINLDLVPVGPSPFYTQFIISGETDILLLNRIQYPNGYFKVRSIDVISSNTRNTTIDSSSQLFKNSRGQLIIPKRLISGVNKSKWIVSDSFGYIMGNTGDAYDSPISVNIAWQIFFPVLKIEMRQLTSASSAIPDLTGLKYPEWPHTMMFAYSNYTTLSNDIYARGGQWGLESNFYLSDVSFDGFYYNSYLINVPLQPNYTKSLSNDEDYYYLAIRGYLPVESAQVMLRFSAPNRYDFGIVKLSDMINEIELGKTQSELFNPAYLVTLSQFNSNFILSNYNFGSNATQNVTGSNITSSNFGDFFSQYNTLYNKFLTASSNLDVINANVKTSINQYIGTHLKFILPPDSISRIRFVSPILSRINWLTMLTPTYSSLDDEWGLGWNLGFSKQDTLYSINHTSDSFFKIQDDYIYLRLNEELNMNGLDAGSKEDYASSREGSGITKQYYCKLLLSSFGGNATTFIHNPVTFNPPINRLSKMQFIWTNSKGFVLNNNDSEWHMTVNITEFLDILTIPRNMPFPLAQSEDPTLPSSNLPLDLVAAASSASAAAGSNNAVLHRKEDIKYSSL